VELVAFAFAFDGLVVAGNTNRWTKLEPSWSKDFR
jgi:hypothetical protein